MGTVPAFLKEKAIQLIITKINSQVIRTTRFLFVPTKD